MLAAGMSSTDSISSARYSRSSDLHGANVTPQLPSTTDVTPCQHDDDATGSQPTWASRWVWTSTNPGLTTRPSASIVSRPSPSTSPTATRSEERRVGKEGRRGRLASQEDQSTEQ